MDPWTPPPPTPAAWDQESYSVLIVHTGTLRIKSSYLAGGTAGGRQFIIDAKSATRTSSPNIGLPSKHSQVDVILCYNLSSANSNAAFWSGANEEVNVLSALISGNFESKVHDLCDTHLPRCDRLVICTDDTSEVSQIVERFQQRNVYRDKIILIDPRDSTRKNKKVDIRFSDLFEQPEKEADDSVTEPGRDEEWVRTG